MNEKNEKKKKIKREKISVKILKIVKIVIGMNISKNLKNTMIRLSFVNSNTIQQMDNSFNNRSNNNANSFSNY